MNELKYLKNWFNSNLVTINFEETAYIAFTSNKRSNMNLGTI